MDLGVGVGEVRLRGRVVGGIEVGLRVGDLLILCWWEGVGGSPGGGGKCVFLLLGGMMDMELWARSSELATLLGRHAFLLKRGPAN